MAQDLLSEYQQAELKRLSRFALSPVQRAVLFVVVSALVVGLILSLSSAPSTSDFNDQQRRELIGTRKDWAITIANSQEEQADWLSRRGIGLEQNIHNRLSYRILDSSLSLAETQGMSGELGLTGRIIAGFLGAALRLGFLVIAAMRLLAACAIWAWWASRKSAQPYQAADALGQTGNGRLFFSGISVDLDNRDTDGSPATQVAGLACPERVAPSMVANSPIVKTLIRYDADNPINRALVAIILHYRQHPDHVAFFEEQSKLEHSYESGTLADYVEVLLPEVLATHKRLLTDSSDNEQEYTEDSDNSLLPAGAAPQAGYARMVGQVLGRVLSPRVRNAMLTVPATEIATLCLALEAGKILLFAVEGGVWNRRSHFPELAARAMLHSCPEFSSSYSAMSRTRLRRALVFSGEPSQFAPMRLPQDLTLEMQALIGFAKVLLAPPHELTVRAATTELNGLLSHIHFGFERIFFGAASELDPELLEDAYASGNVLFLKLRQLMNLLSQVIDRSLLDRLHELVDVVHAHKIELEQLDVIQDEVKVNNSGSHDVMLPPLSDDEIQALATQHKLDELELQDWSILRLALFQYGWLGRRVSERTVPDSSIVFAVLKTDPKTDVLTGVEAVVPLRATRCRDRWGKQWASRFIQSEWARIAETRRDFERLLSGEITDVVTGDGSDDDDETIVGAIS